MLKVKNNTGYDKIDKAIKIFYERVPQVLDLIYELKPSDTYFTYTNDTNKEVARNIQHFMSQDKIIEINGYRPWYWRSSAIGYTSKGKYFINTRKIKSLDVEDCAGNITHEILGHLVGYSHGSNRINEKKKISVPYALGYLVNGEMSITRFLDLSHKYQG